MSERSEPSYDEIRRRVEKRYKERQGFVIHLSFYVIINLLLWLFWFVIPQVGSEILTVMELTEDIEFFMLPWPLLISIGWGIGVVSHYISYYYKYGAGAGRREDAIQREVEQEMARRVGYEKPKNESRMRLSEDGELEEVADDDMSRAAKRNR